MSQLRSVYLNKDSAIRASQPLFKLDLTQAKAEKLLRRIKHELVPVVTLLREFIDQDKIDNFELFLKTKFTKQFKQVKEIAQELFDLDQKPEDIESQMLVFQYLNTRSMTQDEFYQFFGKRIANLCDLVEKCKVKEITREVKFCLTQLKAFLAQEKITSFEEFLNQYTLDKVQKTLKFCGKFFNLSLSKPELQTQIKAKGNLDQMQNNLQDFLESHAQTYGQFLNQTFDKPEAPKAEMKSEPLNPKRKLFESSSASSTNKRFWKYNSLFVPGIPDTEQAEKKASLEKLKREWEVTLRTL